MFLVNSRHPLACAPAHWLPNGRASFSRSYGGNLPSSFSTVLPSALVCSTSPPVSVSGTVLYGGAISWNAFAARANPVRPDNLRHSSPPPGHGILTVFPSATPFGLALGAGSPCADEHCAGTLGLSAGGTLTLLIATHVSIRTSDTSTAPHGTASQAYGTLRYRTTQASCPQLRYVS